MQDVKEKVKQDYLKGMKQKEISSKYDISLNTLKSWIKRYNWASEKKKGAPINKRGAPFSNKNSVGHGAPKENKNAEKFGFFSKYLPEETRELIQEISIKDKFDILWEQITIQYAAIIRAQKIMYVKGKEEMVKELKKYESTENGEKIEYEFQFAWDRQASFLNAQSRAMSELRSLIKQYDEMIHKDWNLATEEQKNRVEKLKCEVDNLNKDDTDKEITVRVMKASGENGK
ncbi:ATPase subunit of terminase family protein [Clostridioides difficile CD149]|uniref:phage terminase small subunit n=23 Tax=Clostridioides difficile TaxID=1496 RepID=UPI00038C81C7|nr:phage terminase small subunit [Clostridioides difficile]EQF61928.1 ATPase subunit of terminase family protein [Clostridioides difficile CD200]EQE52463.1 ATPase subunit of terminase family protein [Clostridioides difficile CD43]EQF01924.1 ATPase subunit of terminase family protein [Clostridioides difficile CD131]EQF20199.1 ATPase subunit of terminase family protein [Clostridioides difficile CD149]EQF35227.1 ATPase subunit of terminase family protein [Clostridioides difficile CD166]